VQSREALTRTNHKLVLRGAMHQQVSAEVDQFDTGAGDQSAVSWL
jgi:hypothetical protein